MWWVGESVPWTNDGMQIKHLTENYKPYELRLNAKGAYFRFHKLKNAKQFAELYRNG